MAESALDRSLDLVRTARAMEGSALTQMLVRLEAELLLAKEAQQPPARRLLRHHADTYEASDEPVIVLDLSGYLTSWNRGAEAVFGYSSEEAIGQHVLFLYADDSDETDPGIAELFLEHGSCLVEVKRRRKSGDVIWVRLALSLIHDDDGEAIGMLVHLSPLAQHLTEEDKIRLYARIIEDSDQGVLITDASERIVSINSSFTRITGYSAAESIGQTPDLLRSGVHDAEFRAKVRAAMQGNGPFRGEIIGKRKNGELFPQSVTISVVRNAGGRITHTFSLFSDISVHKDAEARMQRMANYDNLTGLPNRTLFNHLVGQVLNEARRGNEYGALMVVEVNRIGAISDTLGHDVASEVLCMVGRQFRSVLREPDILARIDGSKFAIALPSIGQREHAGIVAQKLLATLSAPLAVAGHGLQVSANIGIALYLDDSMDTASLLRFAEVALAKAGESGAGGFLFYRDEMDLRARERLRLETELREALAGNQFELHYQPKVSLRSGRIVGAEALIRWAPSGAWHGLAGRVHSAGRGDRPDFRYRQLGHERSMPPDPRLGRCRAVHAADRDQRLGAPVRPHPAGARERGARPAPRGTGPDHAGNYREPAGARHRRRHRDHERTGGDGFGAGAGRLRHRLLQPGLPEEISDQHAQDRPLLRDRPAVRRKRLRHCPRDRDHGPAIAPGNRGRRRRDTRADGLLARPRLRPAARLPVQPGRVRR